MFTSSFRKQRTRLQLEQLEGRAALSALAVVELSVPSAVAIRPEIALVRVAVSGPVAHAVDLRGAEAIFTRVAFHIGEEIPQ